VSFAALPAALENFKALGVGQLSVIVAWHAEERYRTPGTAQAATTVDFSPDN
jgi:hypothetical protein